MQDRIIKLIDNMETALGAAAFVVMFLAITSQVFFRYVLNDPLIWPFELSVFCYIYIIYIGSVMAARRQSHVSFDMVYNLMPPRARLMVGVLTNVFVSVIFFALIPSSIGYISMVGSVESAALGIPWGVVLASFPLGMGAMAIALALRAIVDIKTLRRGNEGEVC